MDTVKSGDVIVFDSVSRMSRNAAEGVEVYFDLIDRGVSLVFLNEHYIDSDIYKSNVADKIELTGTDEDVIFKGINEYFITNTRGNWNKTKMFDVKNILFI